MWDWDFVESGTRCGSNLFKQAIGGIAGTVGIFNTVLEIYFFSLASLNIEFEGITTGQFSGVVVQSSHTIKIIRASSHVTCNDVTKSHKSVR